MVVEKNKTGFWKKVEIFTKLGELFLRYKPVIIFLIGIIPTGSYGIFSYFQVEEKTQEVKATQEQVAQVARAYQAAYVKPEPVIKYTKSGCSCDAAIKKHERLIHLIR